jgi:hypothetical protein
MAFTPNQFLYRPSNVTLRDPQHAARVFTDDQFRLAPKHKFLFHVAFGINEGALKFIDLVQRHRNEINVLVKTCDLPSFTLNTDTLNQYNRKKVVQTTHKFNPINVTFHDDNMGLINQLWQNYYSYYYADPTSATDPGAYKRNATRRSSYINNTFGLDNGSTNPFFNYIKIYQMARHEFVSYTLHNPMITSWNHNKVDYSATGTHENTMGLAYEAVSYGAGDVIAGDPEGFGFEHYDQSNSSLIGNLEANPFSPSFAGSNTDNNQEILNTVVKQINTYEQTKQKETIGTGSVSISTPPQQGTSGILGFNFPSASTEPVATVATKI